MCQELEKLFLSLGYTKEEGLKIRNDYSLIRTKDETLIINIKNSYEWFINFGYTKEDFLKMTTMLPTLFAYSQENMNQKVRNFISLGLTKEEIINLFFYIIKVYIITIFILFFNYF